MTTPLLRIALEPIVARHRRLRFLGWLAVAFTLCAIAGWTFLGARFALTILALAGAWLAWWRATNWEPDYGAVARDIEAKHPQLQHLLRTAVEQQPSSQNGKLNYLQMRVVAEAVGECRREEVLKGVSSGRLAAAWIAFLGGSFLLISSFTSISPSSRQTVTGLQVEDRSEVEVTPGDAEIERGSGLVVLARFPSDQLPTEATLIVRAVSGPEQRTSMMKNFDDPVFGGGLPEVNEDLSYRVDYAGKETRTFKVRVYEHPRLERADARIRFPEYTKLPEKTIADTRRVSAVEGSTLSVDFHLNKPVRKAVLVSKEGQEVPLKVEASRAIAQLEAFAITESASYEVRLEDGDGRMSKVPAMFAIDATKNRRPELKFLAPRGDLRVSPIEEIAYRVEAWDDFGLIRVGLQYTVGAVTDPKTVVLAENGKADERMTVEHLLQLEALDLQPNELIAWHAWAEDIGPDGKVRTTSSDIYFGEVRPFEQIFRQGDSSEEQQQQQQRQQSRAGNQATKLAQLQKQIITATWNLQRAEDGKEEPSEKYRKDIPVVRDSQNNALEQAEELAGQLEDPKSIAFAEAVLSEMKTAIDRLNEAAESTKPLADALNAEKAAYNALLKLATNEFNVTRRQRNSSSRGEQSSESMQQQLDQLELKAEENRYATQREAASPEEQEQREQLAVLNRLKELAQRQQDINEKVKELQAALQEERTEKEKEELRRELKRLKEEQQQMLADLDELNSKMNEQSNQAQFAQERQRLEQTRSEAQQASEAMQRGEASQALASGTRAQRDLQEMRDDLRKKTSKRFTEEMRNMRNDARELADRQQEVGETLRSTVENKTQRRALDGTSDADKATQQLQKQKEDLQKITEEMKQVSQAADGAEPLLAQELYDTLRKSAQSDTARSLEMTQQLAQRGYAQDAQKFEEKARGEIEELRAGVERAAEKVLGDEAEALRKARADLERLGQQVDREISDRSGESIGDDAQPGSQTARGGQPEGEQSGRSGAPGERPGEREQRSAQAGDQRGQPGERPSAGGERQEGDERQAGEGQTAAGERAGQRQQGERQPSQQPGQGSERGEQPSEQANAGQGNQGNRPGERAGESGDQTAQANEQGERPGAGRGQREGNQQTAGREQGPGQRSGEQQPGQQQDPEPGEGQPGEGNQQSSARRQAGLQPGQGDQQGPGGEQSQDGQQASAAGNGSGSQQSPRNDREFSDQPREPRPSRLGEIARAPRGRNGERVGGGNGGPWGGGAESLEQAGPLTGENFVQWSDDLRAVEEMLDDPDLRAEASRIREVAKGMRAEFKRHSVDPKWDMVRSQISTPLAQLRNRVGEELARREKKDALVPIDRDPVPTKFAEQVRKYYENLGRSTTP